MGNLTAFTDAGDAVAARSADPAAEAKVFKLKRIMKEEVYNNETEMYFM